MPVSTCQNRHCQCTCPHSEPSLPFLCRRPCSISRYVCPNLLSSHLLFSLGLGLHEILCVSYRGRAVMAHCVDKYIGSGGSGKYSLA